MNTFSTDDLAITRAMEAVKSAESDAAGDLARPVFHFRPPAQWMNDPNGLIYCNGYFHLFYQHNPYGDEWGRIHWGHARSRDLVRWEHLPIALAPSREIGEEHCYSGSAAVDGHGMPLLIYTSVRDSEKPFEQWAAHGDNELLRWHKHPGNPVMSLKSHGGPAFEADWRDPFVFRIHDRTFLILGAQLGQEAVIPIYESTDSGLLRWAYRGILFRRPIDEYPFLECPNFFPLDGRCVLLVSPYRQVEYFVGEFDVESLIFQSQNQGRVDCSGAFYATNVVTLPDGRVVVMAWIRNFLTGRGWNGCLSLPRELSLDSHGRITQQPLRELQTLGEACIFADEPLLDQSTLCVVEDVPPACELLLNLKLASDGWIEIRLGREGSYDLLLLRLSVSTLDVLKASCDLKEFAGSEYALRLFLDRSVLEVFLNNRYCVTKTFECPGGGAQQLEFHVTGASAVVHELKIWRLSPVF